MLHRKAPGRTPFDTFSATYTHILVNYHGGSGGPLPGLDQFRRVSLTIQASNLGQVRHLDHFGGADIYASVTQDAHRPVNKNIELALQAALSFLVSVGFVETEFYLGTEFALGQRYDRHGLALDGLVRVVLMQAPVHR